MSSKKIKKKIFDAGVDAADRGRNLHPDRAVSEAVGADFARDGNHNLAHDVENVFAEIQFSGILFFVDSVRLQAKELERREWSTAVKGKKATHHLVLFS